MSIRSFFALASLAATLALSAPARAQPYDNYPVCLKNYGPVTYTSCRFRSYAECRAQAAGLPQQCFDNPWYSPAQTDPDRPARRARRMRD